MTPEFQKLAKQIIEYEGCEISDSVQGFMNWHYKDCIVDDELLNQVYENI